MHPVVDRDVPLSASNGSAHSLPKSFASVAGQTMRIAGTGHRLADGR